MTLGDLVVAAFEQAETFSTEPRRVAELATAAVKHNLVLSPDNAAAQRLLCRASRDWGAS